MKVDSSNYADWVRKLRIVLIAAQKAYVLNAPLGVLNLERRLWMLRTSDIHVLMRLRDSSVRNVKRFRIEAPKTFLKRRATYEMRS